MRNRVASRQKQKLDQLFSRISQISEHDSNSYLASHWARYLCICVSGFVEVAMREIIKEYVESKASPSVGNYVGVQLKNFQNPSLDKIYQLVGAFNPAWRTYLENEIPFEDKEALIGLVARRNQIAHGEDSGITYSKIKDYYSRIIKLIELIEDQFNPQEPENQ
jgi:hypothetical protein